MMKEWKSAIYAFYSPVPEIQYVAGRRCHIFKCLRKSCKHQVQRFLNTADKGLMSNMWKHVKSCWGKDALNTAKEVVNLDIAHEVVKNYTANGTITVAFNVSQSGVLGRFYNPNTTPKDKERVVVCLRGTGQELH